MNYRIVLLFFVCMVLFLSAHAQNATKHDRPLSERRVHYDIQVTLNPEERTVYGTERLIWRNPDNVPVEELQFHLYLNAFRDEKSTFMREGGIRHRGYSATGADRWGGIKITRIKQAAGTGLNESDGVNLTGNIRFIQPDDGNPNDRTVISVALPQPVDPGETITLDIDFESKLPEVFARTGWAERQDGTLFFMVGQWFPKLGVYEVPGQRYVPANAPHGRWNTHQFHANSEFYADFGVYEVTITIPEDYVVGATGVKIGEAQTNHLKTVTYRADDVHDFAWTASPAFVAFEDQWHDVNIRLLLQPEHAGQADRHFEAAKIALEYFDRWVGEYPYTSLTLVDGIGGSNGMEYPTLITCGTTYGIPEWLRTTELVIIHEFGHQYFYGMLASNEFEEAWLDEGFTSYLEASIMDSSYGRGSVLDIPGLRVNVGAFQRIQYTESNPERGIIFRRSWEYPSMSEYAKASYSKPVVVLKTLENYLGWETMREILRTYYTRWRFDHPTTRDFIEVAEEVSGEDLAWFFEQYVFGNATVDYAIARIDTVLTDPDDNSESANSAGNGTIPRYEVIVERRFDGTFPQLLHVRFADGDTQEVFWNGEEKEKTFTFDRPVVEAFLDPENAVWLDVNRLNNRLRTEEDGVYARKQQLKFTVWMQQLFYLLASLI